MTTPRQLLHNLLQYVREQAKDTNPAAYRLSTSAGQVIEREALAGLPGVDLDLKVEGDHIWLRVERLIATKPPKPPVELGDVFNISDVPDATPPSLNEAR